MAKSGVIVYGKVLKENTPMRRGVMHFLIVYFLFGGYVPGRPEFVAVYQIYTL